MFAICPLAPLNSSIRIRAFAKINLGLKILGKREDGYHEIRTVYQTVALHDTLKISFTAKPGIVIECDEPGIPLDRRNLVYRACQAWRKKRSLKRGFRVEIEKRIPTGAGLGGGSSDAAATLLGLEQMAGKSMEWDELFGLAAGLGSDVPLFLLGGRVLGCGRGEEVYPLVGLPGRHCLLAHPGFSISTAEAYRGVDCELTTPPKTLKVNTFGVWSQFPVERWGPAENDFEKIVFAKWPELGRIKDQFIRAGAEAASLTGSGSALYAIFASARQLDRASRIVPRGWSVFRTHTLARNEYHHLIFGA